MLQTNFKKKIGNIKVNVYSVAGVDELLTGKGAEPVITLAMTERAGDCNVKVKDCALQCLYRHTKSFFFLKLRLKQFEKSCFLFSLYR